jgi:hypothetical protein
LKKKLVALVAMTAALVMVAALGGQTAMAGGDDGPHGNVIYDSTVSPLPGNQVSYGFEADSVSEFGDQVIFSGTDTKLDSVTVTMSSWACQSGNWSADDCVSDRGATFQMPITFTIYNVNPGPGVPPTPIYSTPGSKIATLTQTFSIPYRPSASPNCTGAQAGEWYDGSQGCFNGLAHNITFDFENQNVTLPDRVVYGISFNTSDYGPSPYLDATACHATTQGCPYDSLNVALSPQVSVGWQMLPATVFQNTSYGPFYCDNGADGTATFRLDSPTAACWQGYIPAVQFTAEGGQGNQHGPQGPGSHHHHQQ